MASLVGCSGVAGVLVVVVGCASPPKMDAKAPIEKRSVFLGTAYEQNGQAIDRGDMIDKLEAEPRAAEELSGYSAFNVTALIAATAGGVLVGWPVGQAIAGEEDPFRLLGTAIAPLGSSGVRTSLHVQTCVIERGAPERRWSPVSPPAGRRPQTRPAFDDSLRAAPELPVSSVKSLYRGGSARRAAR